MGGVVICIVGSDGHRLFNIKLVFRIWDLASRSGSFRPDLDRTFFPESGSGSAKNPDLIPKNPNPDP